MNRSQAIDNFWNSFGIPAYNTATVPDDAEMPYITYEHEESYIGEPVAIMASIWYRSTSWEGIMLKSYEIGKDIGYGGKLIEYDDGAVWIKRDNPFSQRMADEDDTVRRIVLLTQAEYLSAE